MKLKHLLATSLVAFSTFAAAQSIKMEMMQMKMQLNALISAQSAAGFQTSANRFIEMATKTQAILPDSVEGNAQATADYQAGMQQLIDVVKKANEQAQAGKLQEAKVTVSELELIKREYHAKYK